jgi:tripartite-type tricarboxylate transporter receptor subunit TctC
VTRRFVILLTLLLAPFLSAAGAAADDFYQGKTITLLVGNAAGGGYDQYARLLARHMGKHIPGEPAIVVKNQLGAGGILMANALYATAPRDGTTIGMMIRDNPMAALIGNPAVKFRLGDFTWLGTSSCYDEDAFCLVMRSDSGKTTLADLQKPGKPAIFGATAEGGSETDIVLIAREVFHLNLQIVRGYQSSPDILLAIQRGEVDGRAITSSTIEKAMGAWFRDGRLRYLVQFGHATRWKGLPQVPTARELAKTDDDRALLELAELPFLIARPFLAPPGIPAPQAAILKQAFMATHRDPDYLREAKDMNLDISPVSGDEIQAVMARMAQTPPALIERYRAALQSK